MPDVIRDPVHRVRYAFTPQGEDVVVDCWLEPGGRLPEHLHPRQEESWWVVDGTVRLSLDGRTRTLGAADGPLLVAAGTRHALASAGKEEAHLRCVARPALGLQAFLTESAAAAREGLFWRGGIPRSLRGARWAARFLARHREDVVMSFPPQPLQRALVALARREGRVAG